tara:strand:+ start:791 stop:1684 length:894 start_codon:yes stop_codon:yes gene_type:complete
MDSFRYININKINTLIDILLDNSCSIDFLENKFKDKAGLHFFYNFQLLNSLKIIQIKNSRVELSDYIKENTVANTVAKSLFETKNDYKELILDYFSLFDKDDNLYTITSDLSSFAFTANFLFSISVIRRNKNNKFEIDDSFTKYITPKSSYSLSQFEIDSLQKKKIGREAELQIVEYENNRLKYFKEKKLIAEMVSDHDITLGYDILSYSLINNIPRRRFIEVKAISSKKENFFWSIGEITAAEQYGDSYFLYLLPVLNDAEFDLSNIVIITNPYESIFNNSDDWQKDIQNYRFTKK